LRQFVLDDADEAETEVAKVDTERTLWLLYRVNVLDDDAVVLDDVVFVLDIEFRQLLDLVELELLANGQPLRVLVGEAPRRGGDCDRRSGSPAPRPRDVDCAGKGGTGGG
jgi:hypothetical protein